MPTSDRLRLDPDLPYIADIDLTTLAGGDHSEVARLKISADGTILGTFSAVEPTRLTNIPFHIEEDPAGERIAGERQLRRYRIYTDRPVRIEVCTLKDGTLDERRPPRRYYVTAIPD